MNIDHDASARHARATGKRQARERRRDPAVEFGRGTSDDPYDRILRAARRQFATQGFDGTTMREIAFEAEVNLASIRYYFDSKSGLYFKVLQQVLGPLGPRILWQSNREVAPLVQIEGVVREFFDHVRMNPDMPALMVREMASGKDVSAPIAAMMKNSLPLLASMIAKGQQDGSIRSGDPTLLALSTLAQPVYLTLTRRALTQVLGLDQEDPAVHARTVEHAVTTIRAALERRSA
jgi:AcrR family transcriptional regulator